MLDSQESRASSLLLLAGVLLIAFNLRPAITSVGPVLGLIRDDIGLSNWSAGLITSLPLLAFAFMSPIAPRLGHRFTIEKTLFIGLLILLIGISTRSVSHSFTLYVGTTFVGLGIAICNVLLPGLIKEKFPDNVSLMTSMYTTCMAIFAALGSGLSVPLSLGLDLGWQRALLSWGILTVVGLILWFFVFRDQNQYAKPSIPPTSIVALWKSALAWQVTLFMGLQSFLFYVTISWLPEILLDFGYSMSTSGWLVSALQFISLPFTFLAPILANRWKQQHAIIWIIGICALIGYSGLLTRPSFGWLMVCITFIAITLGASISLALTFLGLRAADARQATELSGMAQSIGYLLAACGPIFIGFLFDLTHSWTAPIITILLITILMIGFGLGAARDKYVLD
ncbi:MFS transporter [Radiobacillus kanasensis]|uniref:CynX/NimT family MFS transporter n=1 Tax=Radiobacillus kanasensis TaxID=2844358 RepID=UPI001E34C704|nr:MFS transporter [Radiobacillus kanasensis]UFT99724.1 MFS transporter [Radiobacillus kanasensis]